MSIFLTDASGTVASISPLGQIWDDRLNAEVWLQTRMESGASIQHLKKGPQAVVVYISGGGLGANLLRAVFDTFRTFEAR